MTTHFPPPAGVVHHRPARSAQPFGGMAVILAVMGIAAIVLSDFSMIIAVSMGMGSGEGEGEYGAIKISIGMLLQGMFITLGLVLLVGAVASLVCALVTRRR